jgi:hypothetical protein
VAIGEVVKDFGGVVGNGCMLIQTF